MRAENYENLKRSHPCFGGSQSRYGRIHLPVSPGCNIQCGFCDRKINTTEERPGVTQAVITPQEALDVLSRALEIDPDITVAGIAGPGDTLASDYALETFRLIKERFPQMLKCMSTNGLLLSERAGEIIDVGIDSLTVTVNSTDPAIEAKINTAIFYHGRVYEGEEGASILIKNQLEGIKKVADAGITVKVNTVLIPSVNGDDIERTAEAAARAGAKIYNIIPLIPQFRFKDHPPVSCEELNAAREKAGKYIDVFRHCKHCRADAAGKVGGKDISGMLYAKRTQKEPFSHG